ncbi:hypothetical protein F01_570129 [Burkholderia cenocepacia]|nr:hypothetical protein F01_570129 [Burkholderia cenocepacia]
MYEFVKFSYVKSLGLLRTELASWSWNLGASLQCGACI